MMATATVAENRVMFLAALRSGDYPKGPTLPDKNGIVAGDGFCVCGLGYHLFEKDWKKAIGISSRDCTAIIKVNDSDLNFSQIADKLEVHDFRLPDRLGCPIHTFHDSACRECRLLAGQDATGLGE